MYRCSIPARAAPPPLSYERGMGDVLLAWENEAGMALKQFGCRQIRDRVSRR
jgi:ABC-type sulfate transport system substrate-binding protein